MAITINELTELDFSEDSYFIHQDNGVDYKTKLGTAAQKDLDGIILKVDSIADLADLSVFDGQVVKTSEFHPDFGIGGEEYEYNDSVVRTNHNGVTIISPARLYDEWAAGTWYDEVTDTDTGCFIAKNTAKFNATKAGIYADSTTDMYEAFEAAKNAVSHLFVPEPSTDDYYLTTRALKMDKPYFTLEMETPKTEILCNGDAGSFDRFPEYSCMLLGTYTTPNISGVTSYNLDAVSVGDIEITTTTASDSDNFSEGDIVFIASTNEYTIGSETRPLWGQVTKVVSSSSGVIELEDGIEVEDSNVSIKNLSDNDYNYHLADGTDTGLANFAADHVEIIGGKFSTTKEGAPFAAGGGMYKCKINIHSTDCRNSVAYGNLYAYCDINVVSERFRGRAVELAYCSHGNKYTCRNLHRNADYEAVTEDLLVGCNEGSRNNVVEIGTINAGDNIYTSGAACVTCSGNKITIGKMVANELTHPIHMNDESYSGTKPANKHNEILIKDLEVITAPRLVKFTNNGNSFNNKVSVVSASEFTTDYSVYFGGGYDGNDRLVDSFIDNGSVLLDTDAYGFIMDTYIAEGVPADYKGRLRSIGLSSDAANLLGSVKYSTVSQTITAATSYSRTVQAGGMQFGDAIYLELDLVAGDTGTILLEFAGSTVFSQAIASGTTITVRAIAVASGSGLGGMSFVYSIQEAGAFLAHSNSNISSIDLASNDYDLDLTITPDTSGPIYVRRYNVSKTSSNILE